VSFSQGHGVILVAEKSWFQSHFILALAHNLTCIAPDYSFNCTGLRLQLHGRLNAVQFAFNQLKTNVPREWRLRHESSWRPFTPE